MRTFASRSLSVILSVSAVSISVPAHVAAAQAAPAANMVRAIGTVKAVTPGTLTVTPDKGDAQTFSLPDAAKVVQLAPGSTDLKTAQPATAADIATGDRVLVVGRAGDSGPATALRVVLMKSGAIAQSNQAREADWQRRGTGGVVKSVNVADKTLTLEVGSHQVIVTTTGTTVFRRYAPGSVKFEDARVGSLADIRPGDQVRVRGDKSADATSMTAEEVVSGSFLNLSGLIASVDPAAHTITLKDLATKKTETVTFTADSDLRSLPPEMAARFVARSRGGAAGSGAAAAGAGGAAAAGQPPQGAGAGSSGAGAPPASGGPRAYGAARAGGAGDLSQVIGRLPKETLAELKPGEAVMIVASGNNEPGSPVTAITLLSGVEPLLTASREGGANSFSISPWSLGSGSGGGEGEGGGGSQ